MRCHEYDNQCKSMESLLRLQRASLRRTRKNSVTEPLYLFCRTMGWLICVLCDVLQSAHMSAVNPAEVSESVPPPTCMM